MANVSIANTTANISAQTVLLAGRDQTVTGLHTFDRDPSAPFAVSANSAVVTNLDADKLDGQEGSYYLALANHTGTLDLGSLAGSFQSYTPSWTNAGTANTLGNGTLTGAYVQLGKLVVWHAHLTFGTTTTSGSSTWLISVPVTSSSLTPAGMCNIRMLDVSAGGSYMGIGAPNGSSTSTVICAYDTGSALGGVGPSGPFVWANTDECHWWGFYVAA